MTAEAKNTAVGAWLTANKITDLAVLQKFYDEGYEDIAALDDGAIEQCAPRKSDQNKLKLSLAELRKVLASRELPPGLRAEVIATGFDATQWKFLDPRLFLLGYDNINPVQGRGIVALGKDSGKKYVIPEGMSVRVDERTELSEVMSFRGSHAVDEKEFAFSFEASFGGMGASASVSHSLATFSHIETDEKKTTTAISASRVFYTFERVKHGQLHPDFILALAGLPETYSPENKATFEAFLKLWGTHYLVEGKVGGSWLMCTVVTERGRDTLSTKSIEDKVSASFSGTVSGSASASIKTKTKNELKLDDKDSSIEIHSIGGEARSLWSDWLTTVETEPTLLYDATSIATPELRPIFDPIWKLQTESKRRDALRDAWNAYLPSYRQEQLPARFDVVFDQVGTAATDGFLCGMVEAADLEHGYFRAYTDDTDPPHACVAAMLARQVGSTTANQASLFTPVRAKDRYHIKSEYQFEQPATSAFFQPFPLEFGAWQTAFHEVPQTAADWTAEQPARALRGIPANLELKPKRADTDGFLVVLIEQSGEEGNRGVVYGYQGPTKSRSSFSICAGASAQYDTDKEALHDAQSFCMPVPRGSYYGVFSIPGSLTGAVKKDPAIQARWIPIGPSYRMSAPAWIDPKAKIRATTDGILFGCVAANRTDEISVGKMTLEVSKSGDFSAPVVLAKTAAEFSRSEDKFFEVNSTACVVSKGDWFRGVYAVSEGAAEAVVKWVGIEPTPAATWPSPNTSYHIAAQAGIDHGAKTIGLHEDGQLVLKSEVVPWTFVPVMGRRDLYHIKSGSQYLSTKNDGTVLDLMKEDDKSGRQQWYLFPNSDGSFRIQVWDGVEMGRVYLSCARTGGRVDLHAEVDASGRQSWILTQMGAEAAPALPSPDKAYRIAVQKGVTDSAKKTIGLGSDGRAVLTQETEGLSWTFAPVAELHGVYQIKTGSGLQYLSAKHDGSFLDLWFEDDKSGRQQWYLFPNRDGSFRIQAWNGVINHRTYLSCGEKGNRVDLHDSDDASGRQRWILTPV
jgi:hypothetical protein